MPARKSKSLDTSVSPDEKSPSRKPDMAAEVANLRSEVEELRLRIADLEGRESAARSEAEVVASDPITPEASRVDPEELQAELANASISDEEPDWSTNPDESGAVEGEWVGAEPAQELEIEIRRFNENEGLVDLADLDTTPIEDMQDPNIGIAMDDEEIAALIAEAEAIAKAEIAAKAALNEEEEAFTAASNGEIDAPDSEPLPEDGGYETKEFVSITGEDPVEYDPASLVTLEPERLADLPTDLIIAALACPRLTAAGDLVFLVATPVDEQAFDALGKALPQPIVAVHQPLVVVLEAIRQTYRGEKSKNPIAVEVITNVLGMVKSLFKRAA